MSTGQLEKGKGEMKQQQQISAMLVTSFLLTENPWKDI